MAENEPSFQGVRHALSRIFRPVTMMIDDAFDFIDLAKTPLPPEVPMDEAVQQMRASAEALENVVKRSTETRETEPFEDAIRRMAAELRKDD